MELGLLDEAHKQFEMVKSIRDRDINLPLSEGSEQYLETFADNYDRYVPRSPPSRTLTQTLTHL